MNLTGVQARDSLVAAEGPEPYWTGPFEDDIAELGIRAARWGVEENEGGNRADIMLSDLVAAHPGLLGEATSG